MPLKQKIFASFAEELNPKAILATNTSSISITRIAAAAIPTGVSAASEEGQKIASRVVGEQFIFVEGSVELIQLLKVYISSIPFQSW